MKIEDAVKEYRWSRLSREMGAKRYRLLLIAGRYQAWQMGYLRYVTNYRLWAGHGYAVFSTKDAPVLILPAKSQSHWARETAWGEVYYAEEPIMEAIKVIKDFNQAKTRLGIAGLNDIMPVGDLERLRKAFPGIRLEDASYVVERARCVKSPEEIQLMREDAHVVSAAFRQLRKSLEPGRTEYEVVAEVQAELRKAGGLDGIVHLSNGPVPYMHPPTDRRIQEGDIMKFSIEFTGPNGYWTELGGIFSFKSPPKETMRQFETVLKAFRTAASLMTPGRIGRDIVRAIYDIYVRDGWKVSGRGIWDIHGIGLDVIETPIITESDSTVLQEGMVLCLHPGLLIGDTGWGVYIQDSFVVTSEGGCQLSDIEHKWQEVRP